MNAYAFYSALVFQMTAVIGLFSWGGVELDRRTGHGQLYTVVLSLSGVFIALYLAIKGLINRNK